MNLYMIVSLVGVMTLVSNNVFAEDFETYPDGDAGFVTLVNQQRDSSNDNRIISFGEMGDFLTYVNETPEILQVYNSKEKDSMFWSVENPAQYIQPGKCLVNTIGYDALEKLGATGDELFCSWRLFCGSNISYDQPYAVTLCGKMVQK